MFQNGFTQTTVLCCVGVLVQKVQVFLLAEIKQIYRSYLSVETFDVMLKIIELTSLHLVVDIVLKQVESLSRIDDTSSYELYELHLIS